MMPERAKFTPFKATKNKHRVFWVSKAVSRFRAKFTLLKSTKNGSVFLRMGKCLLRRSAKFTLYKGAEIPTFEARFMPKD
jgi:hypothetical protein